MGPFVAQSSTLRITVTATIMQNIPGLWQQDKQRRAWLTLQSLSLLRAFRSCAQAATPGDLGWGGPAGGGGGGGGTWNAPTPSYTPAYTPADTPAAMANTPGLTDPGALAHVPLHSSPCQ